MIFKQLIVKNFLSFKELSYNFVDKPVLIQGENLTDDSQESNGSGKSAIQAAIEYALFKTTSRKVLDADLINYEEDECEITLLIECGIRKETLVIERKIKSKGSSQINLFTLKNGAKQLVEVANVNDANNYIIDWIGISKEDLQNYFILNKERYKSFFSSSNREKIEMINRFSNAKLIEGTEKFVEDDLTAIQGQTRLKEMSKVHTISTIKVINQTIKSEFSRDFESELQSRLTKINYDIDSFNEKIGIYTSEIDNRLKTIKTKQEDLLHQDDEIKKLEDSRDLISKSIEKYNTLFDELEKQQTVIITKINSVEDNKKEKSNTLQKLQKDRRELDEILADIEKILAGTITCPKCSHKFVLDPEVILEEEIEAKGQTEQLLGLNSISRESTSNDIDKLNVEIQSLSNEKTKLRMKDIELNSKKKEIQSEIDNLTYNITRLIGKRQNFINIELPNLKGEIKGYEDKIERVKENIQNLIESKSSLKADSVDMNRVNEWKSKMRVEGATLKQINLELKQLKVQGFEVSQWIFRFKKFNMHLANQSLKVIQGYCNKFLQDIKSDIQIRWEGIKVLANGSFKDEITSYIVRNNQMKSFWGYSGGERARMDYAMIFTLQEMINKTNKWGGMNFLSTDEIAEGIDSLGLSDLMNSMNDLNKTILITTHVVNRSIGNNILLVRKENGVSKLVN